MSLKGKILDIETRTNSQTGEVTHALQLEVILFKRIALRSADIINLYRPLIGKRVAIECEEGTTSNGRPYVSLVGNGSPELLAAINPTDPAPESPEKPKTPNPLFGSK